MKMNVLISASVLLIGFISIANSYDFDRKQLSMIENMNEVRKKAADKFGIADMQKLVWNKELQDHVDRLDYKQLPKPEQLMGRYRLVENYETGGTRLFQSLNELKDTSLSKFDNQKDPNKYRHKIEHLNPLQNMVACVERADGTWMPGFKVICLLGPETKLSKLSKHAPNQPRCTNELKEDEGGLCTKSNMSESDQLMYISVLNKRRREIAVKNGSVASELVWSKELQTAALNFLQDPEHLLPQNRNWRITSFDSYENGLSYLPEGSETIAAKMADTMEEVEFEIQKEQFFLKQTEIACVSKDRWIYQYLCLLGPKAETIEFCTMTTTPAHGSTIAMRTRFTTEKVTPEPAPTHPKELQDYEEIDGDEYDEDFPTGTPSYKKSPGTRFVISFLVFAYLIFATYLQ
ncbi:hypothetical protein GCK72_011489 [Caenorhabditis remanei]|uniref:SCP domain-containing protein n=1 Tax=Caenorhabditis remanei TaxID=31234 RepID=A0A6A5H9X7_CAERE|nr:hypothetical protein GCK72_011489 [Caenorhabditis remanei]KAF1763223.1 hypothetical protein GCK72_011489 [Caenorhabditis remanei]